MGGDIADTRQAGFARSDELEYRRSEASADQRQRSRSVPDQARSPAPHKAPATQPRESGREPIQGLRQQERRAANQGRRPASWQYPSTSNVTSRNRSNHRANGALEGGRPAKIAPSERRCIGPKTVEWSLIKPPFLAQLRDLLGIHGAGPRHVEIHRVAGRRLKQQEAPTSTTIRTGSAP